MATKLDITGPSGTILDDTIEVDHGVIVPGTIVQFVRRSAKYVVVRLASARREPWFRVAAVGRKGNLRFVVQDLFWLEASSHHVDPTRPLLYYWHVSFNGTSLFRYVGKSETGADRPRTHYRQNVRRLLAGLPYRKSKPDGFRVVHHQLALATRKGWDIRLELLRNVLPRENIFDAERWAQDQLNVAMFPGVAEA